MRNGFFFTLNFVFPSIFASMCFFVVRCDLLYNPTLWIWVNLSGRCLKQSVLISTGNYVQCFSFNF